MPGWWRLSAAPGQEEHARSSRGEAGWPSIAAFGGVVLLAISAWTSDRLAISIPLWAAGLALLGFVWWHGSAWQRGVTGAILVLPLLLAPPLGSTDVYSYACQGWLWIHDVDPYTTGVLDGGCPWAGDVPSIWWHTPAPYGPLAIVISGLAAATGNLTAAVAVLRLAALAAAALLAWQLPKLASNPQWALLAGVLSPLVLIHGISGAHHDLLMTALAVTAFALVRKKPLLAGVLIAAAIAIKVTAIVALPFLLLLAVKRMQAAAAATLTFAGLTALTGLGWVKALAGTGSVTQWSSLPTAFGMTVSYFLRLFRVDSALPVTVARVIGLAALVVIAIVLLRRTWQKRTEPLAACGLLLAAMTLLGPVFYPWYAIFPVAILAATTGRSTWLLTTVIVCAALSLPNGDGIPALTKLPGALIVTAVAIYYAIRKLSPARAA